jgi:DNA-binding NarL/FixJ family response regulator
MQSERIRVLCVDDHRLVREGIAWLISISSDIEVVGQAATGEDAVSLHKQHQPDITLMDLQLPGMSGLEAIRAIRKDSPSAKIIVLTMYHGEEDVYRAIEAGAETYLLKDMLYEDLMRSIRAVHEGQPSLSKEVKAILAERAGHAALTPREIEIVRHVASGMRNKQIAVALGISDETVQSHLRNIFAKFEVTDRTAMLSVAFQRGFLHIP